MPTGFSSFLDDKNEENPCKLKFCVDNWTHDTVIHGEAMSNSDDNSITLAKRKNTRQDQYRIELFGKYDKLEIKGLVDSSGQYWFTQDMVAQALDIDKTTITHMRQNHPGEFTEFSDYNEAVIDGKKRIIYSEEGFLLICHMSQSEEAFRLRRWMAKQFRAKQEERTLVIQSKNLEPDDISDLSPTMQILNMMMRELNQDQRRIQAIEIQQVGLLEEQKQLNQRVSDHSKQIATLEGKHKSKPGEMTAISLASHCGWVSSGGLAHNTAIILAAYNHDFIGRGLMRTAFEQGPSGLGLPVEVYVFTVAGITEFNTKIDAQYRKGQSFIVIPNPTAIGYGQKNKRNVLKIK
jgi:prophage antirepressor-like protein